MTDDREVWFIFSPREERWANLQIATFTKASNPPHLDLVVILGEFDPHRMGARVWQDIQQSEGWFKVRRIDVPTASEVMEAWQSINERT